ncbi:MAG: beta-lactamase family protein [Bacteroidaceae bacterium]|nr:beta-lactamase family protein [Bacteroidaceae bacterium]
MRHFLLLCSFAALFGATSIHAQINELPRATPESMGLPSDRLRAFMDTLLNLPGTDIHSVMVMRRGKVIGEMYPRPFRARYGHTVYSASKTFTAAAVGLAIAENRLRLDDRLAVFFPEQLPAEVSEWLASVRVRDLLTMTSGFPADWNMRSQHDEWVKTYLSRKLTSRPGVKFVYDSIDSYLISAIIQRATGLSMMDYLRPRLFQPLGITEVAWEESPEGVTAGGWGLWLQAESLAKFGQLLLNGGRWTANAPDSSVATRQILPESWVRNMLTRHVDNPKGDNYGYHIWLCAESDGATRIDGAMGQFVFIIPAKEMVVVITQCISSGNAGRRERNALFRQLLPAVSERPTGAGKSYQRLLNFEREAALPLAYEQAEDEGLKPSPKSSPVSLPISFSIADNRLGWQAAEISEGVDNKHLNITVTTAEGKQTIALGYEEWAESSVTARPPYSIGSTRNSFSNLPGPWTTGGSYAWTGNRQLRATIHFTNWISSVNIVFDLNTPAGATPTASTMTVKENFSTSPQTVQITAI